LGFVADWVRGLSDVRCNADALNGPRLRVMRPRSPRGVIGISRRLRHRTEPQGQM